LPILKGVYSPVNGVPFFPVSWDGWKGMGVVGLVCWKKGTLRVAGFF